MNEKTAILNVRMLGDFSITYDGRQVSFGKNTTTKAMKLLQILIYYGEQGIAREKLFTDGMRRFLPLWMRENSRSFMKKRRTVQT